MRKWVLYILIVLAIYSEAYAFKQALPVDRFSTKYDTHFKKYSKRYFGPVTDYRWFKAQGVCESALNKDAISPVGAKGVLQIMPATWKDILRENKNINDIINDARFNISAGIYYDRKLYNMWKSNRPEIDRMCFMLASYNAGIGNPLRAQCLCIGASKKSCNLWNSVRSYAPEVKTWKYKETLNYVTKITNLMDIKGY